jgi:hydrogenase-4 membrane subunit HyfE
VKRNTLLISLLLFLSLTTGWLFSKASFAGRAGISIFYKEYRFLKIWWQGALAVFAVLVMLWLLQGVAQRKLSASRSRLLHTGMVLFCLAGLYFTYYDFRHTTTHRLLGERFHSGAYLFWISWIIISLFYLTQKRITENEKERRHIVVQENQS